RAGGPTILAECRELRGYRIPDGIPTGQAVATRAGDLPARWVSHTVGPVHGTTPDGAQPLADCYSHSVEAADGVRAGAVAFTRISAGAYGWPLEDAVRTALTTLGGTRTTVETATLVLFDEETFRLAEALRG